MYIYVSYNDKYHEKKQNRVRWKWNTEMGDLVFMDGSGGPLWKGNLWSKPWGKSRSEPEWDLMQSIPGIGATCYKLQVQHNTSSCISMART